MFLRHCSSCYHIWQWCEITALVMFHDIRLPNISRISWHSCGPDWIHQELIQRMSYIMKLYDLILTKWKWFLVTSLRGSRWPSGRTCTNAVIDIGLVRLSPWERIFHRGLYTVFDTSWIDQNCTKSLFYTKWNNRFIGNILGRSFCIDFTQT